MTSSVFAYNLSRVMNIVEIKLLTKWEVPTVLSNVRFQGYFGRLLLGLSSSQFDPERTWSV
jgi:hypothetical protein